MVERPQQSPDGPVFLFLHSLSVDLAPRSAVEAYYQAIAPMMGILTRDSVVRGDRLARWQPDHSIKTPITDGTSLSATCVVDLDGRTGTARRVQLKANTDGSVAVALSIPKVTIERVRGERFAYKQGSQMMPLPEYVSHFMPEAVAILTRPLEEQAQFALQHARMAKLPESVR